MIHASPASDFFLMLDVSPNVSLERGESDANSVDPSVNEDCVSQGLQFYAQVKLGKTK